MGATIVARAIAMLRMMRIENSLGEDIPGNTYWVSLRYFCITRLAVSLLLLISAVVTDEHLSLGEFAPVLFLQAVLIYLPLSAVFLAMAIYQRSHFYSQMAGQLVLDICILTVLMYSSGGPRSGLAVLYLLPVAGAAILSPTPLALVFAAIS